METLWEGGRDSEASSENIKGGQIAVAPSIHAQGYLRFHVEGGDRHTPAPVTCGKPREGDALERDRANEDQRRMGRPKSSVRRGGEL